ncbi:MAG: glycosyltransferase family 4 protein [Desulfovibrio sp.]|jgi:glycosyltransferase involved in cell wall biosynthesis|nr:glycosyltransferase family 4 protein [Desulfovibrio sp.]
MKKIAVYLEASPEWGGAFQYAMTLLGALAALPPGTAEICCFHKNESWRPHIEALSLRGRTLRRRRGLRRLRRSLIRRLAFLARNPDHVRKAHSDANALIAEWNPDLLICAQSDFFLLPRNIGQIAPVHDLMHIYESGFPEVGTAKARTDRNRLFTGMAENCAALLVDSPLGGEHLLDNFPVKPGQIRVLPYAAPQSLLRAEPRPPALNIPEAFMFYPAQFWEHKNHAGMACALAEARKTRPDLHCVFSGSTGYSGYGPFRRKVEELGLEGAVTVAGYVDEGEMAWLYRKARCLFMPTFFGPTNIPPLEAMALGCPVAVSGIYAMSWQCGDAALYFDPGSIPDMARAMESIWPDEGLRARLREKGLEKHRQWTEKEMQNRFLSIVMELLGASDQVAADRRQIAGAFYA